MGPRWRYLIGEVGIGLRRNLLMTLATVVTVMVSLTILGAGIATGLQVLKAKRVLYAQVEVSIYLNDNITEEQRQSIQRDLNAAPLVESTIYETKEQAYRNALEIFRNDPELVQALTKDSLPASFRVKLTDPEQYEVVASQFKEVPGIDEVVDQRDLLRSFFIVMNNVVQGALIVAILQLVAAAALVSNTIRLAAFARREQTGIMKLVGATNWYIRLPFLLEGVIAGVGGAAIAGLLLVAGDRFLLASVKRQIGFFPFLTTWEVASVIPVLILVGALVAAVASFFSLRRFLDV